MDSSERSDEIHLPDKEPFISIVSFMKLVLLTKFTQEPRKRFNTNNLGDYHNLHLMSNVYLITSAFENFKDMCLNHCGLDPTHLQH